MNRSACECGGITPRTAVLRSRPEAKSARPSRCRCKLLWTQKLSPLNQGVVPQDHSGEQNIMGVSLDVVPGTPNVRSVSLDNSLVAVLPEFHHSATAKLPRESVCET